MRFLSVCSGIEAASVAWGPLGWKAVAFSEIEPFPCAVLAHHYPDTPNWGDMNNFKEWPDVPIDLLCGGTPCQSFSVAGLRKGLDDPRGNLMLTFGAIAAKYRPKWLVWENVPGVLSSNGGADFGAFLGMLGELGYGYAYRVLDAQYFGVPQRRRRVFVVGCLGDWRSAAAVLFERHSVSGHPAPQRKARETAPSRFAPRAYGGGNTSGAIDISTCLTHHGVRQDFDSETFVAHAPEIAATMVARSSRGGGQTNSPGHQADKELIVTHSLRGEGFDASEDGTGRGTPLIPVAFQSSQSGVRLDDVHATLDSNNGSRRHNGVLAFSAGDHGNDVGEDVAPTVRKGGDGGGNQPAVAFTVSQNSNGFSWEGDVHPTLQTGNKNPTSNTFDGVRVAMQVRRLTPMECERLQGFPDGYTAILNRGKPAADGPRYKALGNSWAIPNVRWIGRRIESVMASQDAVERMKERVK